MTIEGNAIYRAGGTDVPVADGGTGASTLTANSVLLGNGTSALQMIAPSTSGNVLTSNGSTWASAAAGGGGGAWTFIASQATTSSATVSFNSNIDDSTYFAYKWFVYFAPDADSRLAVYASTDNGSSYLSGSYQWQWALLRDNDGSNKTITQTDKSTGGNYWQIGTHASYYWGSTAGRYVQMEITMVKPEYDGAPTIEWRANWNNGGYPIQHWGCGTYGSAQEVDAIKFTNLADNSESTVDFSDAFFKMYGLANS